MLKRLTKEEKSEIKSMMEVGKSLNYISRSTGKNKSTLYYHYKNLFGKKYKDIQINLSDDLFIGELIGLFVGDGYCFYDPKTWQYSVRFFFNYAEKGYVDELSYLFHEKLSKKPNICRVNNVLVLRYYSKDLLNFILGYVGWNVSRNKAGANKKSRTIFLKNRFYSEDFKKGFLRGFIDSDGHISNKKMNFASASEEIILQTKKFLEEIILETLGIISTRRREKIVLACII